MKSLIYYVAASLDGFIAHPDGSFAGFPWDEAYGAELMTRFPETFPAPFRSATASAAENQLFDTVLMGRKTYEVGSTAGLTSPYPTLRQCVVSRSLSQRPDPAVEVIADRIVEAVRALKAGTGKSIWLCGGGELASTLHEAGLIDELIIKLNPVLFGAGIPLFARETPPVRLSLLDHTAYDSGHMLLHYAVVRAEASPATS